MSTLLLTLAGPMQAWGDSSRYARRSTRHEPSKSGVLGLIAAAQGRRRADPLEDLAGLRFAVRSDQPGALMRDYQTARNPSWKNAKLSTRYYLADAVYVAAVEADRELLTGIADSITNPVYPLYLGRRSCPPSRPLVLGVSAASLDEAIAGERWHASAWYRRRRPTHVSLTVLRDATPDETRRGVVVETARDIPVSFAPERREYGWRDVVEYQVDVDNDLGHDVAQTPDDHDPMAAVKGAP